MKKNLRNLELSIPTIDLLESRKIVGGYAGGDQDWPGTTVLDEVIITPDSDPIPDSGIDPHENDNDQDNDQNQEMDNDQNRGDGNDQSQNGDTNQTDKFNLDAALKYLRDHAKPGPTDKCAKFVRLALEAGGLSTEGRPVPAGDYDSFLPQIGYHSVEIENYKAQAGDIVVHEAREGHVWGHIAMYDGEHWISDWIQKDMFGGSSYRNDQDYTIWRR